MRWGAATVARVLKYQVPPSGTHDTISLKEGARILHVGAQGPRVFLWALCDPFRADQAARSIHYYATGEVVPFDARYLGTALMHDGGLVWHVFEAEVDRG